MIEQFKQDEKELLTIPETAEGGEVLLDATSSVPGVAVSPDYAPKTVPYETPHYTVEGLSLDEKEFLADATYIAETAQEAGSPIALRVAAVANEFLSVDSNVTVEIPLIGAATEVADKKNEDLPLTDRFGRHAKKALALLSVAAALGGAAPAANAGNGILEALTGASMQQGIKKAEQGAAAYAAMQENRIQRDNRESEIKRIEELKKVTRAQGNVAQEIGSINRGVGTSAQEQVLAANFDVQKADFLAQREVLKEQFLKLPEPTGSQMAHYKAAIARIKAAEVQADATYRTAVAQVRGQVVIAGAQSGVESVNTNTSLQNLTNTQIRLENEMRALDIQYRTLQLNGLNVIIKR